MDPSHVLTQLRFKNWRSLRDVTIDNLTPITVFIGANSSGKSNILDALHFLRRASMRGIEQAIYAWGGKRNIQTVGVASSEPVKISFSQFLADSAPAVWTEEIYFAEPFKPSRSSQHEAMDFDLIRIRHSLDECWQLLRETFMPQTWIPAAAYGFDTGGLDVIEPTASNAIYMLDYMSKTRRDLYDQFQANLRGLLSHVDSLSIERNELVTRFILAEKPLQGQEAPTISAGTARIIAMLTAYYALDMRSPEQPGLVVIEEPDTAVHPLLLKNLVEMLRVYVDRPEPRQFILTTHNPAFLSYFEPEEVRVVERDSETGETWVDLVPDYIRDIWLDEYGLGDAWMSGVIGGTPEL